MLRQRCSRFAIFASQYGRVGREKNYLRTRLNRVTRVMKESVRFFSASALLTDAVSPHDAKRAKLRGSLDIVRAVT